MKVYNPTDTPQPVDGEGRQVGGREWADVDGDDDVVTAGIDAGRLVTVEQPDEPTRSRRRRTADDQED